MLIKIIKNIFWLSVLSFSLASCGGGGGDSSIATYNDLIGSWSETLSDGDQYVTVVHNNGTFTDYDYLGDSYDRGPDCYIDIGTLSFSDLGGGDFIIDNDTSFTLHITLSGDTARVTGPQYSSVLVRTDLTEADLIAQACF